MSVVEYLKKNPCNVERCFNPELANGYCARHHAQWTTGGQVFDFRVPGTCCADDCSTSVQSTRYCPRHQWHITQHGRVLLDSEVARNRPCSVNHCDRPHHANGVCVVHYNQLRHYGEIRAPKPKVCTCDDCGLKVVAKGLCRKHYERQRDRQR